MESKKRLIDANAYAFPGDLINETTVDAVEVVRCKDCKYYVPAPDYALDYGDPKDTKICRSPNLDYDTECGDLWQWMNPDDFCSCGERKTT